MIAKQIRVYEEPGRALYLTEIWPWSGRGKNCLGYRYMQIPGLLSGFPFVRQETETFPKVGRNRSSGFSLWFHRDGTQSEDFESPFALRISQR